MRCRNAGGVWMQAVLVTQVFDYFLVGSVCRVGQDHAFIRIATHIYHTKAFLQQGVEAGS